VPSQPDKSHAGGFFSAQFFFEKYGQNWNRTSDTRIFSLEKQFPSIALDSS
jgi:hypothetical protein